MTQTNRISTVLLMVFFISCACNLLGDSLSYGSAVPIADAPMAASISLGLPPTVEPPKCLEDLTVQVSSNPSNIVYGQSSVVRWSVDLPSNCVQISVRLNGRAVERSGSQTVTPSRSTIYRVTVRFSIKGVPGETSKSTGVTVTYPSRVVIDQNTANPVSVLLGALINSTNPTQTVEMCNVNLDLTGVTSIVIGDNRSLIASPACARGPRQLGPRIFVTDTRGRAPLFLIQGDNVRFSGFRLEGPTSYIAQGDTKEKGLLIEPFASANPIHNIEVSNMEIYHWSGVGVQVADNVELAERGRLFNTNPNAVRIKNNYFHHNRHGAGEGYGVAVTDGAYALIEQNVFDENRHAIAGGSRHDDALDYSGYTARDNLILSGGGVHCSEGWYWGLTGWRLNCWQTHQIDMHGDQNIWPGEHNWLCGTAGETIIIERNTILYTSGIAIKIRGNPADKAVVDGNVFAHEESGAISQSGDCGWSDTSVANPIDVRPNNVFGADPMAELGSCDFSGDGQLDQFMATGVTWWAKSPVTHQWRYLNTMPELVSQIKFAKVDGDNVCDVVPGNWNPNTLPLKMSNNGTGPWKSLEINETE